MAKVLLTGSAGGVRQATRPVLEAAGWRVEPFDLADGNDLRDQAAVLHAMRGCAAVVHAGAIAHDSAGTPAEIMATNLLGTWHVLHAAEAHAVSRVVYFSSAQVFGFAEGEGTPAYLPVDDAHPLRAARPYGLFIVSSYTAVAAGTPGARFGLRRGSGDHLLAGAGRAEHEADVVAAEAE